MLIDHDKTMMELDDGSENSLFHGMSATRKRLAQFMERSEYDVAMTCTVVFNIVLMIIMTDHAGKEKTLDEEKDMPTWTVLFHLIVLVFFTLEVSAKLWVLRWRFFDWRLNLLDLLSVSVDIIAELAQQFTSMPSLSAFRVIRMLRLVRLARLMEHNRELMVILHSMASTIKAVMWSTVLLVIAVALWAIVAVELIHPYNVELAQRGIYDDCERCGRAFGSVWEASTTFFQQIVTGDSWGLVSIPIIEAYPATAPFFIIVHGSIQLGLMNLIVAAIVDRSQDARAHTERDLQVAKLAGFNRLKRQLLEAFKDIDSDQSGEVSFDEVIQGWHENTSWRALLQEMEINREDLNTVFQIMDSDGSGNVSFEEFVDQVYKMKSMDSHTMLIFIRYHITQILRVTAEHLDLAKAELKQLFHGEISGLQKDVDSFLGMKQQYLQLDDDRSPAKVAAIAIGDVTSSVQQKKRPIGAELGGSSALRMSEPLPPQGGPDAKLDVPPAGVEEIERGFEQLRSRMEEELSRLLGSLGGRPGKLGAAGPGGPGATTADRSNSRLFGGPFGLASMPPAPLTFPSAAGGPGSGAGRRADAAEKWEPGTCCSLTKGESERAVSVVAPAPYDYRRPSPGTTN